METSNWYNTSSIIRSLKTIYGDIYDCVDIYKQPGMDHPIMATKRTQMIISKELEKQKARLAYEKQSSTAKYYNNSAKNSIFNPKELWLNKKGCPIGCVPIRRMSKQQLQKIQNLHIPKYTPQKLDNHSYAQTQTFTDFAGLIVGNAPSGRFTGAKATMTIWNPTLQGDHQYSSSSLYVEDGDNQIVVGWTVHPSIYPDTRTRLFSKWTSDNYAKTGCYINHCPGFVITSNVIPIDYPFPNMSELEGEQFDVTLEVSSNGDWELNYNDQTLGTWPSSIFSKMRDSASQLRFGGECYKPEGQTKSPQMGSGTFKFKQYDKTCYMRRVSYYDPVYGFAGLDDGMARAQISRCYFAESVGYNFGDDWYQYSFMFGGAGGADGQRCLGG
nr:uncharacterized protein LOC109169837 [Ipomoea batatas]